MKKNLKVLVVDDDRRMAKTIYDILKIKDYDVIIVNSGEEAVENVKREVLDCVLMDIRMSGMDGIKTLQRLKELSPSLPVILMSAYTTKEQVDEAKQHGAYTVLEKPIDIEAFLAFLSILRKKKYAYSG